MGSALSHALRLLQAGGQCSDQGFTALRQAYAPLFIPPPRGAHSMPTFDPPPPPPAPSLYLPDGTASLRHIGV